MARYPGATWRPLGTQTEPRITPTCVVLHTAVSNSQSLFDFFSQEGYTGVESHFYVPASGSYDIEQYQDTGHQADAQFDGNAYAISIETWDHADPDHVAWSDWQLDRLAAICAWTHAEHGIPMKKASVDGAVVRGIGYHAQFEFWNYSHHSCPGSLRIAQVPEVITRAQALVEGDTSTTTSGGTTRKTVYTTEDVKELQRLMHCAVDGLYGPVTQERIHAVRNTAYHEYDPGHVTPTTSQVRLTQEILGVTVDGIVGPVTRGRLTEKVKALQYRRPFHVKADGIWGPVTQRALDALRTKFYKQY